MEKILANKIACAVEVSPGPLKGPKVYHIQQPYGEDPC
jgi:hypothetical protein